MPAFAPLRKAYAPVLAALLAAVSTAAAHASSFIVAMEDADNQPFEYLDADGQPTGFHVELVRSVATQLSWDVQFRRYPWKRAQALLETGQVDALIFLGKTPERERFAWFLPDNILHVMRFGLFVRKERASEIRYEAPLTDMMKRWRFGAALGYSYNDEIQEAIRSGTTVSLIASNQSQLLSALLRDRFDVAIAGFNTLDWVRRDMPDIDTRIHRIEGAQLSGKPAYIAFSRNRPRSEEMAQQFAQEYVRWRATPAYPALVMRFGVSDDRLPYPYGLAPK